jgi:hypothetical protein
VIFCECPDVDGCVFCECCCFGRWILLFWTWFIKVDVVLDRQLVDVVILDMVYYSIKVDVVILDRQ